MKLELDPGSDVAPYEQVRTQIAAMVVSGELEPGQRLPTVRQLAAELGLAVNTVARAFRELESDAVIATHGRRGSFVSSPTVAGGAVTQAQPEASRYAAVARAQGLSLAEATRLLEQAWPRP